ncbi:DUF1289 domain-containing protein [Cellvibrio japonicus]|nr:DUF1289 domain-containing protein [Cellvibrio japonicus]QEI12931.1 DUF1289 domain-containing protein [Cellvibrio japonicus]QEI16505.1 DUF1289 domain-containing protein [Cellvibrio japonicus]QEI20083.1 DUF1289 domain-containing protein [Cellvibrio japonicus]
MSRSLSSPCIRNCCLDDDDICLGCFRSLAEITHWATATPRQQAAILAVVAERRCQRQKQFPAK